MRVRTRFAPSPTGTLHIGSARTALFAWLYARSHDGDFILRIEDTDRERSTQESVDAILAGMDFLGLNYDEGPFYQTDRYARYAEVTQQLLDTNSAYRCFCSKERLDELRADQLSRREKPRYDGRCRDQALPDNGQQFVVRFKTPLTGEVSFTDQVYGHIQVQQSELDDLVLVRSDGNPTYNFVVVIDDLDMGITHVIRGDDHINNTPRQINLFNALRAPIPVFAHLPMILGDDGKRLSKRHGAVNIMQFKQIGILSDALLNYLVRLGWSNGDQELFSPSEMIKLFDFKHVSRASASFNYDKLFWLNQQHQKLDLPEQVAVPLAWHFAQCGVDVTHGPDLVDIVKLQADRCKTLSEMCEKSMYFYQDQIVYNEQDAGQFLTAEVLPAFSALLQHFNGLEIWDRTNLNAILQDSCRVFELKMVQLAQPLRVAVTGSKVSPSMDITLEMIGKIRVLHRLSQSITRIKNVGNISL